MTSNMKSNSLQVWSFQTLFNAAMTWVCNLLTTILSIQWHTLRCFCFDKPSLVPFSSISIHFSLMVSNCLGVQSPPFLLTIPLQTLESGHLICTETRLPIWRLLDMFQASRIEAMLVVICTLYCSRGSHSRWHRVCCGASWRLWPTVKQMGLTHLQSNDMYHVMPVPQSPSQWTLGINCLAYDKLQRIFCQNSPLNSDLRS